MAGYGRAAAAAVLAFWVGAASPAGALDLGLSRMMGSEEAREWRAVGRVNFAGARDSAMCTGALIAPALVLTAAHCVVEAGSGAVHAPGNVHFVAGWRLGTSAAHRRAALIVLHPDYDPAAPLALASVASDLALIRLESPIDGAEVVPLELADRAVPLGPVTLVSYRRDRPHAPSRQDGCTFAGREGAIFALDCEITFGVSGAPVFDGTGADRRIVGVISAMGQDGGQPRALAVSVAAALPALMLALP